MNGAELAQRQLGRCCDVLAAVDAAAPTLCAGWSAYDLAVHLWLIKRDPVSWPGVVPPLAGLMRRRAKRVRRRWSYQELVDRLRREPGTIACMPLDRFEDYRHSLGEYFIHTQDVARPHGIAQPEPDDALSEALWLRAQTAARILRRRLPAGLILEHADGRRTEVGRQGPRTIVKGRPTELICWVYGREQAATVTISQVPGAQRQSACD